MAQLKDLLVTGASRLIGDVFTNKIQVTKIDAPTTSNGTTYGPGSSGQVLMSNGTSTYWGGLTTGVSGVKGNAESTYRTGNVNLTPANLGAAPIASPALTGTPTAPTAASGTNNTQIATTAFVYNAFTANDAMVFKGVVNSNSDLPATHYQGWTYKVGTAGTYAGKTCEVGDTIYCVTDGTAANNDHWVVVQANVDAPLYKDGNTFAGNKILLSDGTGGKVKEGTTVGAADLPIYLNNGVPTTITSYSGKAATAGIADSANAVTWSNVSSKPINFKAISTALGTTGWQQLEGMSNGTYLTISKPTDTVAWGTIAHSAQLLWGTGDTKGLIDTSYSTPLISFAGGNISGSTNAAPKWYFKLSGTSGATYTFPAASKTLAATDGTGATGTWGISISGNAATATKATQDSDGNTINTTYLKLSGGTMTGNLTINTLTASQAVVTDANKKLISANLTTSDPSASGTGINYIASISQSATGKITATKSTVRSASTSQTGVTQYTEDNLNTWINQLGTGSSTPTDADYYISQYVGGGTTTTTYHRRPMSALWSYVKGKITAATDLGYVKKSGDTMTGDLIIDDALQQINSPGRASLKYVHTGFPTETAGNTCGISFNTTTTSGSNSKYTPVAVTNAGYFLFSVPCLKNGAVSSPRFVFYQKSIKSADATGTNYYEIYTLPKTTHDLTENASYDILTTKGMGASGQVLISDGSTANWGTLGDSFISYGGKNFSGSYSPIDGLFNNKLRPNRFAGFKAAGTTIQYSNNGGSTWTDYGAADATKIALFTTNTSLRMVPSGNVSANSQLRIIMDTGAGGVYTVLQKIMIYISTNYSSNCTVTIDAALQNAPTNFTKTICTDQPITGWSGWNVINIDNGLTTYGNTATSQYGRIRFTFKHSGVSSGKEAQGLVVQSIYGYGGMGWTTPSTLAATDHVYSFDQNFNVTFPRELHATKVWGAVWNDYAEMRNVPEAQKENSELKPGMCVHEVGDGTMAMSINRLERGCKIISDTFGFNIGETEYCKTPIAVSGRALVYINEGREIASSHIGWPVCSGPNGTVSIMTEEEEEKYPSRIIGTISEIPNYEEWGTEKVKVNGRIWIYVK